MSFSTKKFLQKYGSAGFVAYGSITMLSTTGIYLGLRSGVDIILPLEKLLGTESDFVENLKAKLREDSALSSQSNDKDYEMITNGNRRSINWVREGTYFGIAGALDSFVLPLKLMVCLPLARFLIKIRVRRGP
mmetsp:Transcript_22305/g.53049  ORF Transcript_22305/g.53049 Transcript_22305/m.53049 type:complete len:133 (+) Transcript_22305:75-473(+)